jgi:hypothetical protein
MAAVLPGLKQTGPKWKKKKKQKKKTLVEKIKERCS